MKIKIGIIQTPLEKDAEKVWEKARKYLELGIKSDVKIICLPELWLTGFRKDEELIRYSREIFERILDISKKHSNIIFIPGTFPEKEADHLYNSAYIIKNGNILYKRRKRFLFALMNEDRLFNPGDGYPEVIEVDGIRIFIIICYELRFSSMFENAIKQESDIVFILAQWPEARITHWDILLKARALETQSFIAAANVYGKTKSTYFCGNSSVIHPMGDRIGFISHTPGIITVEIDTEDTTRYRKLIPIKSDMERYG